MYLIFSKHDIVQTCLEQFLRHLVYISLYHIRLFRCVQIGFSCIENYSKIFVYLHKEKLVNPNSELINFHKNDKFGKF